MSRSNPHDNAPNPSTRWFEWNGETGVVRYYDKVDKKNVDLPLPFSYLLLDELASVGGWNESSSSSIYSNEVRDTRTDPLIVKCFKGGILAEGLYASIKERVTSKAVGGQFVAKCYIGYKGDNGLQIGSLRLKGAALGSWMEFRKANRHRLYDSSIRIMGFTEGKKGRIVYRMPTFELGPVSPETNSEAVKLDKELQAWLEHYFSRRTTEQVTTTASEPDATVGGEEDQPDWDGLLADDDIPF